MKLGELKPQAGARKKRKRIGCGPGSGHGKTACRGHKGQRARSGTKTYAWFEGGQMPLQRRVPKRGFHNMFKTVYQIVNLKDLQRFEASAEVDVKSLRDTGLARKRDVKIKLLGGGEIDRPLKISVHACTKSAREQVEKAGGQINIIEK
ncbi:MAG: 50S ribosomal protein L15 [Candidatus Krumholzibacteria bacterium]|nr:50S ribosomal protein L15 [Candidatus Krumholzibacteria bacterium]